MAKASVTTSSGQFGTTDSAGLPAVYGTSVTLVTHFNQHKNPDGTTVKDTRT